MCEPHIWAPYTQLLGNHYVIEHCSFSFTSEKKNIQHQCRYAHLCPILITRGEQQLYWATVHSSEITPRETLRGELWDCLNWTFELMYLQHSTLFMLYSIKTRIPFTLKTHIVFTSGFIKCF